MPLRQSYYGKLTDESLEKFQEMLTRRASTIEALPLPMEANGDVGSAMFLRTAYKSDTDFYLAYQREQKRERTEKNAKSRGRLVLATLALLLAAGSLVLFGLNAYQRKAVRQLEQSLLDRAPQVMQAESESMALVADGMRLRIWQSALAYSAARKKLQAEDFERIFTGFSGVQIISLSYDADMGSISMQGRSSAAVSGSAYAAYLEETGRFSSVDYYGFSENGQYVFTLAVMLKEVEV